LLSRPGIGQIPCKNPDHQSRKVTSDEA